MASKLRIKVGKRPSPDAAIALGRRTLSSRTLRKIFGRANPSHKVAILLPGADVNRIEVALAKDNSDDLMALAKAVGVTNDGGEEK